MAGAPVTDKPLIAMYEEWILAMIDEEGVSMPHALQLDAGKGVTVHALDLPPPQAYRYVVSRWMNDRPQELVFALDRFAKADQGTTLGDLVAGFHFVGTDPRPFVIEYQHEPRIVKDVDWSNTFWNAVLRRELATTMQGLLAS